MVSRIERFENVIAWQKARVLMRAIYQTTRQGSFAGDFGLSRLIQRASVSIMSNVAEGFERGGRGNSTRSSPRQKHLARRCAPSFTSHWMPDT